MTVALTTCVYCGHRQKTVQPWARMPKCAACGKPMRGKESK